MNQFLALTKPCSGLAGDQKATEMVGAGIEKRGGNAIGSKGWMWLALAWVREVGVESEDPLNS